MIQKVLGLLSLCLLFTACDPIEGSIQVLKPFTMQTLESRNCGNGEQDMCRTISVTVPAGSHSFTLTMKNNAATLDISAGRVKAFTDIQIPSGKTIPDNGTVVLTAQESQQSFTSVLNVKTIVSQTDVERGEESCTVTVYEDRCDYDRNGNRRCQTVRVDLPGTRQVEFYYRNTDKYLEGKLTAPNDLNDVIATLSGSNHDSDKIYTFQGQCFSNYPHYPRY